MKKQTGLVTAVGAAVVLALAAPQAQATYPVIDVAAITQLIQQISYWREQISAMSNQLDQLRQTHAALTGSRGMQSLLSLGDAQRNYLPKDWAEVARVLEGQSAQYGQLASATAALVNSSAVLTPADLGRLAPGERGSIVAARQSAAGLAVMTREAYAQASARFASLAQLVQALGTTADAKAAMDLEGRIAAEQAMLENEQAKLELLSSAAEADRQLRDQQLHELAMAGHGDFGTRLHPRP
jgi:type IV secretion system protein VirB5